MARSLNKQFDLIVRVLGVLVILASGVVLVTSSGGEAAAEPTAAAVAVDAVAIKDFKFAPAAVTVAVGTTITWTNSDNAPHTATSGSSPTPDGLFDTDIITKGQSKKVKLMKAGTFQYYCALHPFMHGTVVVR